MATAVAKAVSDIFNLMNEKRDSNNSNTVQVELNSLIKIITERPKEIIFLPCSDWPRWPTLEESKNWAANLVQIEASGEDHALNASNNGLDELYLNASERQPREEWSSQQPAPPSVPPPTRPPGTWVFEGGTSPPEAWEVPKRTTRRKFMNTLQRPSADKNSGNRVSRAAFGVTFLADYYLLYF